MTGFGRAESVGEAFVLTVEARSVNHRHLDIALRLPRALTSLETDARKLVQSRLERGRVDVAIQLAPGAGRSVQRVVVDPALARQYAAAARSLEEELVDVRGDVRLEWLLERPGVLRVEDVEPPDAGDLWPMVAEALGRALGALIEQRTTEGQTLAAELRGLGGELRVQTEQIAARAPAAAARREERLRERLRSLVGELAVDEGRILIEAAAWAEKTDVTEELARLRSHLDQLAAMLDKGGPVGRPLDFLIQELGREINTVGSKSDDFEVSQAVLFAKGILEKMREQTQNLE